MKYMLCSALTFEQVVILRNYGKGAAKLLRRIPPTCELSRPKHWDEEIDCALAMNRYTGHQRWQRGDRRASTTHMAEKRQAAPSKDDV